MTTSSKSISGSPPPPVAIIGMACIFPRAGGLKKYWRLLWRGQDAIGEVPPSHWSAADYYDPDPKRPDHVYCTRGGYIEPVDFDPSEFGIPPSSLEATDTSQLLSLLAARMALTDAGYGPGQRPFDRERTSVVIGVTGTQELVIPLSARLGHPHWRRAMIAAGIDPQAAEAAVAMIGDQYVSWQESSFPGLLGNVVAGRISNRFDLGGTNCAVDAACASSFSALNLALLELWAGRSRMAITGGADLLNDIFMHMCFAKSQILSTSGDIRPFSKDADGTVLGEGVGLVVIKPLADAERDGDRVYALIRGIGAGSDGRSSSIYAPRSEGQLKALGRAYESAGVDPATVEMIEAHGTGTRVGDRVEFSALRTVFNARRAPGHDLALGSVKSMIGHTKAAAGAAGLIKAALALHRKVLLPTLKVNAPDPGLKIEDSPFYLNTTARPWTRRPDHPRRCAVSAFGFGGSNFHVVLEEYSRQTVAPAWDGTVRILALSADDLQGLQAALTAVRAELGESPSGAAWAAAARRSCATFNVKANVRLTGVIAADADPAATLARIAAVLEGPTLESAKLPEGVFLGDGPPPGKLALLFPGQGSQYLQMGRDLVCVFPEAREALETLQEALSNPPRLCDLIYPPADFAPDAVKRQRAALQATDRAQPAIGALSMGWYRVLTRFGVVADAVAGHSFGELTALWAAGRIDAQTFARLAAVRGEVMAAAGRGAEDPGTMLAVKAPLAQLDALPRPETIILANRNSPRQGVFSGPTAAIAQLEKNCRDNGLRAVRLSVAAAFHSFLIAGAREPFADAVQAASFSQGTFPVYGNTHAVPYPDDPAAARRTLADQMLRPVDFVGILERLYAQGFRTFLEVGPKGVLTGLVGETLGRRPHSAMTVDRSAGRSCGLADLALTLAQLAAMGYGLDLSGWEEAPDTVPAPRMQVPLSGANHRNEKKMTTPKAPSKACNAPQTTAPSQFAAAPVTRTPSTSSSAMTRPDTQATPSETLVTETLKSVQAGLKAIETLQTQTTQAHRKFLEVQQEASRTLQQMMASAGLVSQALLSGGAQNSKAVPGPLPAMVTPAAGEDAPHPVPVPAPAPQVPAPIAAALSPSVPPTAASEPGADGALMAALVQVVSELTGYPESMLGAEMDIEADLGIDSIKRVEILSALEERLPGQVPVSAEQMGTLKTLGDIAAIMAPRDTDAPVETAVDPAPPPASAAVDVTRPELFGPGELDRLAPRQIVTPAPCERTAAGPLRLAPDGKVLISGDDAELGPALARCLADAGVETLHVPRHRIAAALTGDASLPRAVGLVIIAGAHDDHGALKQAFALTRHLIADLSDAAGRGGALLATVSRLDGAFGFLGAPIASPSSGALAALAKTAALEIQPVVCRALDIGADWPDAAAAAAAISAELAAYSPQDPVEIGLTPARRFQLELKPAPYQQGNLTLRPGDVVVATGGARGVTAEALAALAGEARPVCLILGRSALPGPEPEWLAGLTTPAEIRQALLRGEFADRRVSPRELAQRAERLAAEDEIRRNLKRLKDAGATVEYRSLDVRRPEAMGLALAEIRERYGPIRALIHGAGTLADRRIADKTDDQFAAVFDTKVLGFENLLNLTADDPLRYVVLFSSVAARLGNPGQVDYAMANELLNKQAQHLARQRPDTRVLSINWGPWDGGMVDASLKRHFTARGIRLLAPAAGAAAMVRSMADASVSEVQIVVGSDLAPATAESKVQSTDNLEFALAQSVDLENFPVLADHVLAGRPVVPLALMIEWLGHTALHANPGLTLVGLEELRLLSGIKLDGKPHPVKLMNGPSVRREGLFEVPVALYNGNGKVNGSGPVHSRARAILAEAPLTAPAALSPLADLQPFPLSLAEAYGQVLFHGERLRGIRRIEGCSPQGMVAHLAPAPAPSRWVRQPLRSRWLTDPLVLDAAFQMAILWGYAQLGMVSLPSYAESYRQYCKRFPSAGVTAEMRVRSATARRLKADIAFLDDQRRVVAVLSGYEATMDPGLDAAFKARAA